MPKNSKTNGRVQQAAHHPLGYHHEKLVHPDPVLRQLGVSDPVHPNEAVRVFWRYCKRKGLIR
jgi:hypothetical protein